jgi:hypothetical protein
MATHQCDCFIPANEGPVWSPDDTAKPTPARPGATELYRPDILEHIEATIKNLDKELRELSLEIHSACLSSHIREGDELILYLQATPS